MLFDSHAHYDDEAFDGEREEVLKAVREEGVQYIVNAGSGIKESQMSVELAQKYDYIYAAVGVHPENADEFDGNSIEILRGLTGNKKVVAVGEIGLDYYYEGAQKDTQKKVFEEQLNLAMELKLPVIIHSREAHEDTFDILKPYALKGLRGVLHCYSGSVEMAREYVKLGFYIGFTGVITFKNAKKAVEVLKDIPIERVLIETDCPYLAPVPFRGKRNDSRFLKYTARRACDVLEMEYEDFTGRTLNNARELFNL
jgi:hydrolase, TatD family